MSTKLPDHDEKHIMLTDPHTQYLTSAPVDLPSGDKTLGTRLMCSNFPLLGTRTRGTLIQQEHYFHIFSYFSLGEPLPEGPTIPTTSISLKLDADCQFYLSNMTVKANFLNTTKYSIAIALNTSVSNIKNMEAECGSIVVNFTLVSHDGTNEALKRAALKFGNLVTSDLFKVIMDDTQIFPFTLRVFGVNMSETFVSPYFHRKFATTPTTQPTEIQPLVIDYKPFMIAVSVVSVAVIACVCCTCCSHSWYLRKKKYTEFNSDKVVPKVEVPVVEEEEEEEGLCRFYFRLTQRLT